MSETASFRPASLGWELKSARMTADEKERFITELRSAVQKDETAEAVVRNLLLTVEAFGQRAGWLALA